MTHTAAPSQSDEQHVMTGAHTPTPWEMQYGPRPQRFKFFNLSDAHAMVGTFDAGSMKSAQANAAFIVRAVNAHDDLVKALEHAVWCLDRVEGIAGTTAALNKARTALSRAKGDA